MNYGIFHGAPFYVYPGYYAAHGSPQAGYPPAPFHHPQSVNDGKRNGPLAPVSGNVSRSGFTYDENGKNLGNGSARAGQQHPTAFEESKGRKRPAVDISSSSDDDDDDDDDDDESDSDVPITENCDQVRRKINNLINNGEMKVTHFQRECGITSRSYQSFMKKKGKYEGSGNNTYYEAFKFFEKRKRKGIKEPKQKRVKQEDQAKKLDTSAVELDGEHDQSVPVYDTCDEVRRKIRAYLKDPSVTKAGFARELRNYLSGSKLQPKQVDDFLRKKGPLEGNTAGAYYAGYVFFEKQRIQQGKPKSKHRLGCEDEWPSGVDITRARNSCLVISGQKVGMNAFGRTFTY